ncbi:MAG: hypothetical protein ACREHC_02210, partial [Candidatus Levyibacteriota bacterium]
RIFIQWHTGKVSPVQAPSIIFSLRLLANPDRLLNKYLHLLGTSSIVKVGHFMDTDTQYKNRIGQRLTTILVDAVENNTIPEEQIPFLATVIREELAKAKTSSDVFAFVEELAAEWPIFSSVLSDPTKHIVKNVNRRWLEQIVRNG